MTIPRLHTLQPSTMVFKTALKIGNYGPILRQTCGILVYRKPPSRSAGRDGLHSDSRKAQWMPFKNRLPFVADVDGIAALFDLQGDRRRDRRHRPIERIHE
ncbi:hypothetical protein [Robbsia sp. KACC 23696]|uniref:hypothetical protein n=1 Tax=Robbsia sp. KACC 23696 TaxID=3149231 RepID=UPI00325C321C